MALAKVRSCALVGLDGALVEVEVDVSHASLPSFTVVGLPDAAVQEARERVRAAVRNLAARRLVHRQRAGRGHHGGSHERGSRLPSHAPGRSALPDANSRR
jgi:hypothetical protein